MAKIYYSALVNSIRGRVSHSVLSIWKGIGVVKRHNANPRQPRSCHQQRVRGLMNDLAGDWYGLSSTLKEMWSKYASLLSKPMSGMNAYQHLNLALARYFGTASIITSPPPSPSTPEAPWPFTTTAQAGSLVDCTWTVPTDGNWKVLVYESPLVGLDDVSHPRWDFVCDSAASLGICTIASSFPVGTHLRIMAKSIDSYGRVSPQACVTTATLVT